MFFDVIVKPQTWRNVGYLLLSFPLGIFYFVFLVTGLALGFGLSITLLGIPLLIGVLAAAYGLGEFERTSTNLLLDQATPPSRRLEVAGGLWPKVQTLVQSSETWKRVGYLMTKFGFGIASLVLVTVTGSMFGLIASPLLYERSWWQTSGNWFNNNVWSVDTLGEAIILGAAGVLAGFVLLHVINGVAKLWGAFADAALGPTYRPFDDEPELVEATDSSMYELV